MNADKPGTEQRGTGPLRVEVSDIDEHIGKGQIETAILRAKDEWERTFESVTDMMAVLDTDHNIIRMNRAMAEKLGLPSEDCTGRKCFQCVHGSDLPIDICPHEQTMKDGKEHTAEIHDEKLGGDFLVSTTPLRDDKGNITGSVHIIRDITLHKQAEKQLTWMASFPHRNPNPIIEIGPKGAVTYMNAAAERLFPGMRETGLEHPFLKGMENYLGNLTEMGRDRVEREVAVDDKMYIQSLTAIQRDGHIRIYCTDITKRHRAEQKLRESQESLAKAQSIAHLGSWELDIGRNSLKWSDETYRIFGLQPGKFKITYEKFLEMVHPEDRDAVDAAYRESLERGTDIYDLEHRILRSSGEVRWVREKCSHILDADGKVARTTGMVLDITERKTAQEEEMKNQEQLMRHQKLATIGSIAGGVAHNLRNPLASIKNAAYFLKMKNEQCEPDIEKALEIIDMDVSKCDRIITGLLDFSNPRKPTRVRVVLPEVVEGAMFGIEIPADIMVNHNIKKENPVVLADPDHLDIIFTNIITNAIQSMPYGGKLRIDYGVSKTLGVSISFKDTGMGIPEETLKNIFDPLFTTKEKGVGLGLSIARALIAMHGGTIEAKSITGKGSTFIVRLPSGGSGNMIQD